MKATWLRWAVIGVLAFTCTTPATATSIEQIADRGPATFLVGTIFTTTAPLAGSVDVLTGNSARLQGCRFLHGVKMLAAGVVLLPAGILAAPANPSGTLVGWVDALPDAFQEDYCSRPASSIMP